MDATTKTKTYAVALVALMVGSVFVAGVASAHSADSTNTAASAHVADPAGLLSVGNPIRVLHSHTNASGDAVVVYPENATIDYNQTYDVTLTAIWAGVVGASNMNLSTVADSLQLYDPSGAAVGTARQASNDTEHCGMATVYTGSCTTPTGYANVTFFAVKFTQAGTWSVKDGSTVVDTFTVGPHTEFNVAISTASATYSPTTAYTSVITVTNASGAPVVGAAVNIFPSVSGADTTTNANGQAVIAPPVGQPYAGTYHVFVNQSVTAESTRDVFGETNFTISASTLSWVANTTTAYTGFQNNVTLTPKFGNTNGSFVFTQIATNLFPANATFNLTVTVPNGSTLYTGSVVHTTLASGLNNFLTLSTLGCTNPANTTWSSSGASVPCNMTDTMASAFGVDTATGKVFFAPGSALWAAGTYTFALTVNINAAGGSEYSGSTTLAATSPASVNLALTDGTNTLTSIPVLPGATDGTSTWLPGQTVYLNITGSGLFEHPTCESGGPSACVASPAGTPTTFVANVTVSGPVLSNYTVSYANTTGIATISNLVTTGAGNVTFAVAWKGTTTTLSVPTTNGGNVSSDTTSIQVTTLTNFTITVKDFYGNLVPSATITAFLADGSATNAAVNALNSPAFPILGNGGPTMGQGGVYNINITPTSTTDLVLQANMTPPGSSTYGPYALYKLKVVAGHDLNVTISKNQTSAGLSTFISVNATNGTGIGVTPGNSHVFFLTATEKANVLANGSSALFSVPAFRHFIGSTATPTGTAYTNSSLFGLNATVALGSGTYYVYVVDACGATSSTCPTLKHDNLNNMPTLTVSNYTLTFSPTELASNASIQPYVVVNVTITDYAGAVAPNGTLLRYSAANSTGIVTVGGGTSADFSALNKTVTSGNVQLNLTGLQAGDIMFEVNPAGTGILTGATGVLKVVGPNVTVTPTQVQILSTQILTVSVTNFTGGALAGVEVRACGISLNANFPATPPTVLTASDRANCTAVDISNSGGIAGVAVSPTGLAPITIYVNNVTSGVTVSVYAGTLVLSVDKTSPKAGDTVTITAAQGSGQAGSAGITVNVTRDGTLVVNQTTDAQGHVVLSNVSSGNYSVVAMRSGFLSGFLNFTVGAASGNVTNPNAHFVLSNLNVPASGNVGTPITVSTDVTNDGAQAGTANLLMLVNNNVVASFTLPDLGAGETQTVQFQPFTPTVAGTYHIQVKIGTQASVDKNVTVNPVGTTTTTATTTSTTTSSTPVSTTTTTTTTTSPVTTSPVTTTTTTTSTTPSTTTASPNVPGFELVVLVGALAAALLVLRRRN